MSSRYDIAVDRPMRLKSRPDAVVSLKNVSKRYPIAKDGVWRRVFPHLRGIQLDPATSDAFFDTTVEEDEEENEPGRVRGGRRRQRRRAVDDITLRAYAGTRVGLVGPPGCGKSTLLKLMGGVIPPTRGRIVIHGTVAPALGQLARLLPVKGHTIKSGLPYVAAAVGLPPELVRSRLDEIGELLDFPRFGRAPTTYLESRRKREVILATMLVVKPDVLLLDLPLANDAFGRRCLDRIDALCAEGTLVVAELPDQRKTALEVDRVIELRKGLVVADSGAF